MIQFVRCMEQHTRRRKKTHRIWLHKRCSDKVVGLFKWHIEETDRNANHFYNMDKQNDLPRHERNDGIVIYSCKFQCTFTLYNVTLHKQDNCFFRFAFWNETKKSNLKQPSELFISYLDCNVFRWRLCFKQSQNNCGQLNIECFDLSYA